MKIIVTASKDDVDNKYRKTFNELQHRLMIEHDANNILSLSKELLTDRANTIKNAWLMYAVDELNKINGINIRDYNEE